MTKAEYRKKYIEKRSLLSEEECAEMSNEILAQIKQMDIFQHEKYMFYAPMKVKKEVDISPLTNWLLSHNKQVYLPKIKGDEMEAVKYTNESEMDENDWGISEPSGDTKVEANQIDVFIIPMLICDSEGNRIGYGKGFYDKFLANSKNNAIKIGVNYFPPEIELFHTENTDIPLDYCALPEEIVSFGAKFSK